MINPINLLVWNVRGISRCDTQRYLHKITVNNSVKLLVLIEPLSDVAQLDAICRLFHFSHARSFLEEKIWIFWLDSFALSFCEVGEQLVHMQVSGSRVTTFYFSAIYAKCTEWGEEDYEMLWRKLGDLLILGWLRGTSMS